MKKPVKTLLVGNSARGHAIAEAVMRSSGYNPSLFAYMKTNNPGIADMAEEIEIGPYHDLKRIVNFAQDNGARLAIIDPEDPLYYGAVDALESVGIPSVGPLKTLARLETSKAFTRDLLEKYRIRGNPKYEKFKAMDGIKEYLENNMPAGVVLKPDGLTGGKGVKVQGEHFVTLDKAMAICEAILKEHEAVVIEEKLEGEEFSLQCFCDGTNVVAMPPVQDHKRRLAGDRGNNTGSMGSISFPDFLLPFLTRDDLDEAIDIVRQTIWALFKKTGHLYKGIAYGGFMITKNGIKLIEFNARFGDPEAINVLPLLETDFLQICLSITDGKKYGWLNELDIKFKPLATVCKYVVPVNYAIDEKNYAQTSSDLIHIGDLGKATAYYSSVTGDGNGNGYKLTSSRAVAVLGKGGNLAEAERIAEQGALAIKGAVDHRSDIGTAALVAKRVQHMAQLRGQ